MSSPQHVTLEQATITRDGLLALLPFGPEALFLDEVTMVNEPTKAITAPRALATGKLLITEQHCIGHFPHQPLFPGHLMIEAANQIAGAFIILHHQDDISGFPNAFFFGASNFSARRPFVPGEIMDLTLVSISFSRGPGVVIADFSVTGSLLGKTGKPAFTTTQRLGFIKSDPK